MDPEHNPYQSPTPVSPVSPNPTPKSSRSPIPKVIGILCFVLAGLSGLGLLFQLAMLPFQDAAIFADSGMDAIPTWWTIITIISGIISVFLLIIAGINLVKYKMKGRNVFKIYAIFAIVMTVASLPVTVITIQNQLDGQLASMPAEMKSVALISGVIGGMFGIAIALALPIIGLILLKRPRAIASLN